MHHHNRTEQACHPYRNRYAPRSNSDMRILLVQPAPFEKGRLGLENMIWMSEPGEHTFAELTKAFGRDRSTAGFSTVSGIVYRTADAWHATHKRNQTVALDDLPMPAAHLVQHYRKHYFFMVAQPMASIFTSRGCS